MRGHYFLTSDEQLRVKFISKLFQNDCAHTWGCEESHSEPPMSMFLWLCFSHWILILVSKFNMEAQARWSSCRGPALIAGSSPSLTLQAHCIRDIRIASPGTVLIKPFRSERLNLNSLNLFYCRANLSPRLQLCASAINRPIHTIKLFIDGCSCRRCHPVTPSCHVGHWIHFNHLTMKSGSVGTWNRCGFSLP